MRSKVDRLTAELWRRTIKFGADEYITQITRTQLQAAKRINEKNSRRATAVQAPDEIDQLLPEDPQGP